MGIEYAVIGGSGFYELVPEVKEKAINTPFGLVKVKIANLEGKEVAFLARHGGDHSVPPHLVNYQGNIFALHSLGVKMILASSAVGSLQESIKPGEFIIPDQFLDFTIGRPKTFFDGNFEIKLHSGKIRKGVVHVDLTHPYCTILRDQLLTQLRKATENFHTNGVYVCTEGPRFETPAEIKAFQLLGGTIVGMTSVSECVLARELNIHYASICLATNFAAGLQQKITVEEVFTLFREKGPQLKSIIMNTIFSLDSIEESCECNR